MDDIGEIEQIRDVICQWSDGLASNIDASMKTPLWDEKRESEYFTDKPDWEAFGALVMLQACRLLNRPVPEYVENGWDAFDEPVVKEAMSQIRDCSLLSEVTLWLPIPKDIIFRVTLPSGNEASISTLTVLKNELEVLNQKMWKADVATILSWRNEKYYVPLKSKKPKLILGFIRGKNHPQKRNTVPRNLHNVPTRCCTRQLVLEWNSRFPSCWIIELTRYRAMSEESRWKEAFPYC